MRVKEWRGEVVFMHEVAAGAVPRSWGVHVARLAGVPEAVAKRAEILLKAADRNAPVTAALPLFAVAPEPADDCLAELVMALERLEPDKMTPRDALAALYDLHGKLMARQGKAV
jgi:DNA mismatch repair protein MutS